MSGKTSNSEGIKNLLSCDVVYDWDQQLQIRDALRSGLNTLVFAHDEKPKTFRGFSQLFKGAKKTSITTIRCIMAGKWRSSPNSSEKSTGRSTQ